MKALLLERLIILKTIKRRNSVKRSGTDEKIFGILKKLFGDDIYLDSTGENVLKNNRYLPTDLIQYIYSNTLPWSECKSEALRGTEHPEDILYVVFYHDFYRNSGKIDGVGDVFDGIARNEIIQLPTEVKILFSKVPELENRLKEIAKSGWGEEAMKLWEEGNTYNIIAEGVNQLYLENNFQEK